MASCSNCPQVKAEHRNSDFNTSNDCSYLEVGDINIDFVVWLPGTRRQNDSIWLIKGRLTKSAHFVPVKFTYSAEEYERFYLNEIVRFHGIPLPIISE